MLTPSQIIDDIRTSQYGIGLPPDSTSLPVIVNMRGKLDRALKLLSQDLYAKDIHFVLELLQNAEDNGYAPGAVPEVRLILTEDAILLQNNELGFAEENVRSLCDVANSSKTKRLGYIGEKGIGFKSVFRVTNEPYISSNGFSFSLPLHDPRTNLGYVIPVWRDTVPAGIDPHLTNILLPLTPKGKLELPKVADIQPSLLLFLKKLRRIEIHDASGACTKWIFRQDEGDCVRISSNSGTDHWRVVRQPLPTSDEIKEEKRQGVSSVEIVLAFPLSDNGTADASAERPVYSFLPIRACGFRFAIQADFILASSREDILSDRPWNQWLRDAIPTLFLKAVDLFKADDKLRTNYLAFVPSSKQVTDSFFEEIPGTITNLLKETECILTASDQWALPSHVLLVSDPLRSLLSNEEVQTHLNKEFIDTAFQADLQLLTLLGVKRFSFTDLLTCLKDMKWLAAKGDEWLLRLYAYLSTYTAKEALEAFCALSLVPLESGLLESPTNGQIFLPLDRRTKYGFETGLRIVRKSLFKAGDAQTTEAARKFLRGSLGIRFPESTEIINQHILPVFEGDNPQTNWKCKDAGFLIGAVEYIKDHLEQFVKGGGSLERLTKALFIKFVHAEDRWYGMPSTLYLSKEYGNANDLETVYQGIDGIHFVDPAYLAHSLTRLKAAAKKKSGRISINQKRELADSWRAFFVRIGVEAVLRVTVPSGTSDPDKIASEDLAKVIKTQDADRLAHILRLLDSNWGRYRPLLSVEQFGVQRNRRYSLGFKATSFYTLMWNSEWIPTQSHGLCKPSQVCIDCPENKDLLGDNVPYLSVPLTNEELIANLHLQKEPSVSAALACLRELAEKPTVDHVKIRHLYDFLNKHFEKESAAITEAFQEESLTYVPEGKGRFHLLSDVFWKDMSWLFGKKRGYLSKYWRDLKEFFLNKLKVRFTPDPKDYVALLKELSQADSLDSNEVRKVWEIYREIERRLAIYDNDDDPTETAWWKEFVSSGLFWTDREEFWQNEDDVYVNDQEEYYELFKGKGDYAFLVLPENQFPSFRHLIDAGKLQKLSEAVQVCDVTPRQPRQNQELTALLREAAPFIIRYLYFKDNEVYRDLQESEALSELIRTSVQLCDGMTVAFELHGERVEVERDAAGTVGRLYVRNDVEDFVDRLGVVVSNLLRSPRGLDSFICLLLAKKNREAMERLMEAQRIPPMPTESSAPLSAANEGLDETTSEGTSDDQVPVDQSVGVPETDEGQDGEAVPEPDSQESEVEHAKPGEAEGEGEGTRRPRSGPGEAEGEGEGTRRPRSGPGEAESEGEGTRRPRSGPGEAEGEGEGTRRPRSGPGEAEGEGEGTRRPHSGPGEAEARERTPRDGPARNWFRVLATPGESSESTRQGQPPPKDDLAREKVIEYEQRRSRPAVVALPNQKGYDVSSDDKLRGVTRRIEVKGLQQRWTGDATVALTGPQFDASRREPQPGIEYWLYVVDGLCTDSPRVHPILRPAAKVERVYLQAQDWLGEVDQADRDRVTDKAVADLGVPVIEFSEIVSIRPTTTFVTRYPKGDLADIIPVGGLLKCQPSDSTKELPSMGKLVMLLPAQLQLLGEEQGVVVGEFRWSVRQSLEGVPLYVEVSLRPKTPEPGFGPAIIRVTMADWPGFRPYAVCEALLDT